MNLTDWLGKAAALGTGIVPGEVARELVRRAEAGSSEAVPTDAIADAIARPNALTTEAMDHLITAGLIERASETMPIYRLIP